MGEMRDLLCREKGTFRVTQRGADGKPIEREIPFDALTLTDTAELEALWDSKETSFLDSVRSNLTAKKMLQVVWFAVRKFGKTRNQVDSGDIALTCTETGDLFNAADVRAALWTAFQSVMTASGYVFDPRPTQEPPTKTEPAAASANPANDTPKANP